MYNNMAGDGVAAVTANPLYKPGGFSGLNPFYKEDNKN